MSAFLSYSRKNERAALDLALRLKQLGASIWIDQIDISLGTPWDQAVEQSLRTSSAVVVLLSGDAVISPNVLDEIAFALESRKKLIPVLLERCEKPLRISRLQHIDLTTDWDAATVSLASALKSHVSDANQHRAPQGVTPATPASGQTQSEPSEFLRKNGAQQRNLVRFAVLAGAGALAGSIYFAGARRSSEPIAAKSPLDQSARIPVSAASSPCAGPFEARPISCLEPEK